MNRLHSLGCALAACALLTPLAVGAQTAPPASYHVLSRWQVGGQGWWDYLTAAPALHRLFVSRGTHVMVVSLDRDSVVGDLPNTPGVHGIALALALGRGFTSNGRDSTVTIFALRTLAPIATVHVTGRNPDAILYDPATRRVFTFNGGSDDATAIDAVAGKVVGTIPLGGRPEFAASDARGHVYANIEDSSQVVRIDPHTLRVVARWPLAPCEHPSGMAIDRVHERLFIGCHNGMMAVMNARTGKVVATVRIGRGVDANRFDPGTRLAFASCGDGTLTVVHEDDPDHYHVVQTVATERGARTMALDERTHRVYTVTARFGPRPAAAPGRRRRPPMIPGSFTIITLAP